MRSGRSTAGPARADVRGRRDGSDGVQAIRGATRIFESQVLPLVLARAVRLAPAQCRAVELYREEFLMLREQMRVFMDQLDEIRSGFARFGV